MLPDAPDALLDPTTVAQYTIAVKSTMFAGFSMLMYDHLITFGDEVELIWKKPKSAVFALFVLNRYTAPCIIAVNIYDKISPMKHSIMFCKAWILLQSYLTIICYLSSHTVVAIRVNALHNGHPTIKRLLWIGGISYALSTFAILTAAYPAMIGLVNTSKGACVSKIPSYLWVAWMPTIVFETTLFVLTVYFVLSRFSRKAGYGVIYASLFLDGAIYFVIVAACAIVSLVIWAQAPPTLIAVSRPFSISMATIAGSRLILNLRRRVSAESELEGAFGGQKSQGPGVSGPGFDFVVHSPSQGAQSAPDVESPL